jgi:multicomponent K+:H+ antiporter subunit D
MHYIVVNLAASALFLIGVSLIYGVTGTLNMADIARKMAEVPAADQGLLRAGAAILGVAFLAKAALWPLNFWLPPAYGAASAPAAAIFAVLTKVGVYAVLRLWTLCFPAHAEESALFGSEALVWGGLLAVVFGSIGMLASQRLDRLAGFSIITSSGTLVAAIGFDQPALSSGALFYLASSTLAASALFLLVDLLERARQVELAPPLADPGDDSLPFFLEPETGSKLDDEEVVLIGRAIPAALAFLGLAFAVCALVVAGLPPLSGFVGKLVMLSALVEASGGATPLASWTLFATLIVSGLLAATALVRIGIRHFWAPQDPVAPRLRVIECVPIALLLTGCILLVARAGPVLDYMHRTAEALHAPDRYIKAVMAARPVARQPGGGMP